MLGDREASLELRDRQRDTIQERGRAAEVANPGDPGPDAVTRAGLEGDVGIRRQLLAGPRPDGPVQRQADAKEPVVDQHGDLLGEPFLEAQSDQVAPRELEELGRPRPHGQQSPAESALGPR